MRTLVLTIGLLVSAAQAEAPPAPPVPMPGPPAEFAPPEQPTHGPVIEPVPAQRLAMLDAGRPLPETDLLVGHEAALLAKLTAVYVEDAPRIAELSVRTVQAIRAGGKPALALEILEAASHWPRRPGRTAGVPRIFESDLARYRELRTRGNKDHAQAQAEMQAGRANR